MNNITMLSEFGALISPVNDEEKYAAKLFKDWTKHMTDKASANNRIYMVGNPETRELLYYELLLYIEHKAKIFKPQNILNILGITSSSKLGWILFIEEMYSERYGLSKFIVDNTKHMSKGYNEVIHKSPVVNTPASKTCTRNVTEKTHWKGDKWEDILTLTEIPTCEKSKCIVISTSSDKLPILFHKPIDSAHETLPGKWLGNDGKPDGYAYALKHLYMDYCANRNIECVQTQISVSSAQRTKMHKDKIDALFN